MNGVAERPAVTYPVAPKTLAESGLSLELITDLVLKTLHRTPELSGTDLGRRLGLSFALLEPSLDQLKTQRQCEICGGQTLGGPTFRYRLTDIGHTRAMVALERNQYVGAAPIPIEQYRQYMDDFHGKTQYAVNADQVREAFSHLVLSDRVLDEIGPAVNAGQSLFIYGPPGNGKTVIAFAVRRLLNGSIAVPQALAVGGHIIRFFDPSIHEPIAWPELDDAEGPYDGRWILCERPMVAVGGELTLESLSLAYNPRSGIYHAPVQALANGGVLLIDDFGRQRCSPRDLLNWWMVPLESHVESLPLQSGEKVDMPFMSLVIFATNLKPSELVDEAFLRRIQYKIYAESPTREDFIRLFELQCREREIPFSRSLVVDMLNGFYQQRRIERRSCQPRDLIEQALSLATYRCLPRRLTAELLLAACQSYFIEDDDVRAL